MRRSALVILLVAVMGACTAAADRTATTDAGAASVASPAPTTTSVSGTTTSAAVTTSTDPGLRYIGAGYVFGAVGDVQSVAPNGRVMVVADREQICVQKLDALDVDCVVAPPEFRSRPRLAGGWAADGTTFVFEDRSATAIRFRSTLWALGTAGPALELLLDDPDITVWDAAVHPQRDVIALRGTVAGVTGVLTLSAGGAPELVAQTALGDNLEWLPDGVGLLFDSLGDTAGVWRMDLDSPTPELLVPLDGRPALGSVSSDGSWALIYDRELAAGSVVNQSHYEIAHLGTGEVSALEAGSGGDFLGPVFAAFSPDGSRIAYLYRDGTSDDAPLVLAVRPTGGGEERIISRELLDEAGYPPSPHRLRQIDVDLRAVWTEDDRVLFPTAGWVLVVELDDDTP